MKRVLATGFEPFGGSTVNPSQQLIEALDGDIATALLPVSYARAADALRDARSGADRARARRGAARYARYVRRLDGARQVAEAPARPAPERE